jgi:hypothetical protein
VSLLAGAGLASLLAVGALGLGGLALWGDSQKDERGYVSTGNADGSRGVQADISAGAKLPFLNELGWSAIGSGTPLLLTAVGLLVLGVRAPRRRSRDESPAVAGSYSA